MSNCHICRGDLNEFERFSELYQVTSDCRPWRRGGSLCICQSCGTVQKPVTKNWLHETKKIYSNYEMYSINGSTVFGNNETVGETRPKKIIRWLNECANLPRKGKLLEVGFGSGSFLRDFSEIFTNWEISGLEIDRQNKESLKTINGDKKIYFDNLESCKDKFDLIVLIHSLEHIPYTKDYLKNLIQFLKHTGSIFVDVPDLENAPFDILVADHCTHFTFNSLKLLMKLVGIETTICKKHVIPKELFFLGSLIQEDSSMNRDKDLVSENYENQRILVVEQCKWLKTSLDNIKRTRGKYGVFGSSIAATWLVNSLGDKIVFFLDEDLSRVGKTHMERQIYSPSNFPKGFKILLPLRHDIARVLVKRLSMQELDCVLLPLKEDIST